MHAYTHRHAVCSFEKPTSKYVSLLQAFRSASTAAFDQCDLDILSKAGRLVGYKYAELVDAARREIAHAVCMESRLSQVCSQVVFRFPCISAWYVRGVFQLSRVSQPGLGWTKAAPNYET